MRLSQLFLTFLQLGLTSFGGPVGAMALLKKEIQEKRKWVNERDFEKSFFISKLLPGPVATQLSIRLGFLIAGRKGGLLSGVAFILPALLIVLFFSGLITRFSGDPNIENLFTGLRLGALAVIVSSVAGLGRPWVTKTHAWIFFLASLPVLVMFPRLESVMILIFGVLVSTSLFRSRFMREAASLLLIFWVCFKSSLLIFGTGLAVVPLLETEFVKTYHWITHEDFFNGLVIGQITPGPILITATYLGDKTAGLWGALAATFGTFLPSFMITLFLVPWMERRFADSWEKKGSVFLEGAMPVILSGLCVSIAQLGVQFDWTNIKLWITAGVALGLQVYIPSWLVILLSGVLFQMIQTL